MTDIDRNLTNQTDNFKIIFDSAPIGMILVDEDCKILKINKSWKNMMCIDEISVLGKRFGDGFRCIESIISGCGSGANCMICKIRNTVGKVMESEIPFYDMIVQNEFVVNNKNISPWLKTSFIPHTIEGVKCVLISADDITESMIGKEKLNASIIPNN